MDARNATTQIEEFNAAYDALASGRISDDAFRRILVERLKYTASEVRPIIRRIRRGWRAHRQPGGGRPQGAA